MGNPRQSPVRTEEGVVVHIIDNGVLGRAKPEGGSIVFVRGLHLADDKPVDVAAYPAGTYHYTAVNGASKNVRALELKK